MTRVSVFIDYQNAYMRARDAFGDARRDPYTFGQFDPQSLGALLRDRGAALDPSRDLQRVHVFRGEPDGRHDPIGQAACQRQVSAWSTLKLVRPVTRPLRYRPTAWSNGRPMRWDVREKGIDVLLAVDLVMGASRDEFDVAILMSADTDLVPALESVMSLGKRVEVASWKPVRGYGSRLAVPSRRIWCHWLDSRDYDEMRDHTDYTLPAR